MFRISRPWIAVALAILLISPTFAADKLKLPLEITVEAGTRDRIDALVEYRLPEAGIEEPATGGIFLTDTTGGQQLAVAVQLDSLKGPVYWVAHGTTAAGAKRTYRLDKGPRIKIDGGITMVDSETAVEARFGDMSLLRYNKAHVEPPPGTNPKYGRSAHLHPVRTPSGAIVTDEFPPDHLHQSGIFLAYTKTEFEGRPVDFWNLAGGQGRVRFKNLKGVTSGPIFGRLIAEHEHVDLTATDKLAANGEKPAEGKVALFETWDLRAWNVGTKSGYWLLDITSRITCASESPLRMPEYHYGGMAIRAARPWRPQQVNFLTSEGHDRIQGNHARVKWCDVSGPIDGRTAGITIMTHPSNFRFPEPLRIHPTMPYMVYTPSFLGDWEIRPGTPHEARYRFIIHDGDLAAETAERLWRDFAEPLVAIHR